MPEADVKTVLAEAFQRINELSRRLRAIEERYELNESKTSGLQESMMRNAEADKGRAEELASQIRAVEEQMLTLSSELSRLSKLVEKSAKRSEIEELRSLIELYAPFKHKE